MTEELYRATIRFDPDFTGFDERVRAQMDEATRGRDIRIGVDTGDSTARLAALDAEVKAVDADAKSAGGSASFLSGGINGIALAAAGALPLLPTLAGGVGGLAGLFTAAGTSAVSFGAVVETGIKQASEAMKKLDAAQQKVYDATTAASRKKALEEQAALIQQIGPDTIRLGVAIQQVEGDWKSFAGSFIPDIVTMVQGFERLETDVLPKLSPLVNDTFGVVDQVISRVDAAVNSSSGSGFFAWLDNEGPRDLGTLGDAAGKVASGFGYLLEAFTPVEREIADGIDTLAGKFADWASGASGSSSFQYFLSVVEKDGPLLVQTLLDVGGAVGRIAISLAPIVPPLLHFIDGTAKLIEEHPALAATLGALFVGFEALTIVSTITIAVSGFLETVGTAGIKLGLFSAAADTSAASIGAVGVAAGTAEVPLAVFTDTAGLGTWARGAVDLSVFAAAETTVGARAAAATPEVAALGAASASTAAAGARLLGVLGLLGVGVAAAATQIGLVHDLTGKLDNNPPPMFTQQAQALGDQTTLNGLSNKVFVESQSKGKNSAVPPPPNFAFGPDQNVPYGGSLSTLAALNQPTLDYIRKYGTPSDVQQLQQLLGGASGTTASVSTLNNAGFGGGSQSITYTPNDSFLGFGGGTRTYTGAGSKSYTYTIPNSDPYQQFIDSLNDPSKMLPLTGSGGTGSGPTVAQTLEAIAALQGLDIGKSLLQGIVTGTSPIDSLMRQLNQDIGEKAQPIADQFKSLFDKALSFGQQAEQSLEANLATTSAPNIKPITRTYQSNAEPTNLSPFTSYSSKSLGNGVFSITETHMPTLADSLQSTLQTDQSFVTDLGQAKKLGLNADLLQQFVQAGPSSLGNLNDVVQGGKSYVSQLNSLDNQINTLAKQYGLQQAMNKSLDSIDGTLHAVLTALIGQLPTDIGNKVAAALNAAAKTAAAKANATPALGVFSR